MHVLKDVAVVDIMLFSQGVYRLTSCFDVVEKLEWMRSGMLMLSVSGRKKERAKNILFTFFMFYEEIFSRFPSSCFRQNVSVDAQSDDFWLSFGWWKMILLWGWLWKWEKKRKRCSFFCEVLSLMSTSFVKLLVYERNFSEFISGFFFRVQQVYLLIRNGNWSGIYQIWCVIYSHSSSWWWYQCWNWCSDSFDSVTKVTSLLCFVVCGVYSSSQACF